MSWYAVDALGDAYEETKEFLLPFDLRLWLKIAVIVFFVGSSPSFQSSIGGTGGGFDEVPAEDAPSVDFEGLDANEIPTPGGFVIGVIALILGVVLVYTYLSAVFEFVFYRSLEDGEVALRSGLSEYAYDGLKYFLFNWGLLVVWLVSFVLILAGFFANVALGLSLALGMVPVWLLLFVVSFYVRNLTVPDMVVRGVGFFEGLRSAYGYVREEWKQAGLFLVAKILVGLAAGVTVGVAMVITLVAVGIPLVILGVVLFLIHPWLVAIPAVLGILAVIVASFAVSVPVQTYVYRWVLDVHGGFTH